MWNDAVSGLADAIEQNPGIVSGLLTSLALAVLLILVRRLKRWAAGDNLPIADTTRMIIEALEKSPGWRDDLVYDGAKARNGTPCLSISSPYRLTVAQDGDLYVAGGRVPLNRRERRALRAAYAERLRWITEFRVERVRAQARDTASAVLNAGRDADSGCAGGDCCEVTSEDCRRATAASRARG